MIKLYNTLTRKKETLKPIKKGVVSMYTCGPTVYNYAHIGNLRTYVFMDLLRRTLKYNNLKLNGVMNITDVGHLLSDGDTGEDKMAKTAREQKKTPTEIANYYTKVFFDDLKKLNIEKPEHIPKATDYIKEMIEFVSSLIKNGHAYETDDGIYYDVSTFKDYGMLSGNRLEDQLAGARIEVNLQKRHPADFALWKKAPKNHIMQWPSPWGMGYPGWHIECSAMGNAILGETFDIHTGGIDHIPVHHENEIAQNFGYCGSKSANFWIHSEFMLINNGKMSKSLKNVYTLSDLEKKGFSVMDFRYFCLNTHYRKKLNFTFKALTSSQTALNRLVDLLATHKDAKKSKNSNLKEYKKRFKDAINDDLNVPLALGVLWEMLKEEKNKAVFETAISFDQVFGLGLKDLVSSLSQTKERGSVVPDNILKLAEKRLNAKKEKNYNLADSLREEIKKEGFLITDTKEGYTITQI